MGWQKWPPPLACGTFTGPGPLCFPGPVWDPIHSIIELLDYTNDADYVCKDEFMEPQPARRQRIREKRR